MAKHFKLAGISAATALVAASTLAASPMASAAGRGPATCYKTGSAIINHVPGKTAYVIIWFADADGNMIEIEHVTPSIIEAPGPYQHVTPEGAEYAGFDVTFGDWDPATPPSTWGKLHTNYFKVTCQ